MNKHRVLLLLGGSILFLASASWGVQFSVKGTPPEYVGLGEFENPSQSVNIAISKKEVLHPNVPVLKHAFAIDRGRYGTALKIYLEAEDPQGVMTKIATTVDQVGYGHYPTDFILLKPEYQKEFKGYIQWNTFSSHTSSMHEFVRMFVTVAVLDNAGRFTDQFVFPFTFQTGVGPVPKPPEPFDQRDLPKLGNVSINLFDPFQKDGGNRGNRR